MKISISLKTNKILTDGTYPITIKYSNSTKRNYIHLGYSVKKEQWVSDPPRVKSRVKNSISINKFIEQKEKQIEEIENKYLNQDKTLTFELFANEFNKVLKSYSFSSFARDYIDNQIIKEKTRQISNTTLIKLHTFLENDDVEFYELNLKTLNSFKNWLVEKHKGSAAPRIYLSTLRSLFNKAIEEGVTKKDYYFFDKLNIKRLDKSPNAITLDKEQAIKLFKLRLKKGSDDWFAQNLFKFSFYSCGLNPKDIFNLTWQDFEGDQFTGSRMKSGNELGFRLDDNLRTITKDFKKYIPPYGNHLVPCYLEHHITEKQREYRKADILKKVNDSLKVLGKKIGLNFDLKMKHARSAWATISMDGSTPLTLIMQGLGHKDLKSTMHYLKKFDSKDLVDHNKNILS